MTDRNHTPEHDLAIAQDILDKAVARIREDYDMQRAEADRLNRECLDKDEELKRLRAENESLREENIARADRIDRLSAKHERLVAAARGVMTEFAWHINLELDPSSVRLLRAALSNEPDSTSSRSFVPVTQERLQELSRERTRLVKLARAALANEPETVDWRARYERLVAAAKELQRELIGVTDSGIRDCVTTMHAIYAGDAERRPTDKSSSVDTVRLSGHGAKCQCSDCHHKDVLLAGRRMESEARAAYDAAVWELCKRIRDEFWYARGDYTSITEVERNVRELRGKAGVV